MSNRIYKLIIFAIVFCRVTIIPQDLSDGIKLIKVEKYNKAKKYFSSLLNTSQSAYAYFYLGQIYFDSGDLDSAKLNFLNGINQNQESAVNYAGLFNVNIIQNNLTEAEKNKTKALELNDDKDALVYLVLSQAYSNPQVKQYKTAVEFLNDAIKIDPKYVDAYIELGDAYLNQGNGSDAIKNFDKALELQKGNPEALMYKAGVYSLINDSEDAIKYLNQAINSDSTYAPAYKNLAEVYATLKDYAKATEYYAKYINHSEATPENQKRYASMLFINKEYEKAIKILEDSYNSQKDPTSTDRILAYSYQKLDNLQKSKYYFEKLFSLPSVDYLPTDYEYYADLLSKSGQDSLAINYLSKIVAIDSSRKDIWGKISVLSFKTHKWDEVINALQNKKNLTTQEYFDLGKALMFKGDQNINDIIQSLNSQLGLTNEQLALLRSELLYYQKDLCDAGTKLQKKDDALNKLIQSVESFLEPNQKSKWGVIKTKWISETSNKISCEYAEADTTFSTLISKVPNLPVGFLWKARISSDFDPESINGLAKPFYERFIQQASNESDKYKRELVEAYAYLGYYYYLQKDNAKSKSYWQQVLLLDPVNKQANDVIKQMK